MRDSKFYRKIWEQHQGPIPAGYEIHHIDGNPENNQIENLKLVTPEEHFEIHWKQEDWGAAQAILMRLGKPDMISIAASKFQKQLWEEGRHNFQMTPEERSSLSRKTALETVRLKKGIHAINANPILAKENARRAGIESKKKRAGFHADPMMGGNAVRGTKWWTNTKTKERRRCFNAPGLDWKRGMICM